MKKIVTQDELDKIEKSFQKTTPGPWEYGDDGIYCMLNQKPVVTWDQEKLPTTGNLNFIVNSRSDIPNMIHTIRALYKKISRLELQIEEKKEDKRP